MQISLTTRTRLTFSKENYPRIIFNKIRLKLKINSDLRPNHFHLGRIFPKGCPLCINWSAFSTFPRLKVKLLAWPTLIRSVKDLIFKVSLEKLHTAMEVW